MKIYYAPGWRLHSFGYMNFKSGLMVFIGPITFEFTRRKEHK